MASFTPEQFQAFMDRMADQFSLAAARVTQVPEEGGGGQGRAQGRRQHLHQKAYSRIEKFQGGEEKWKEWSYDFIVATQAQCEEVAQLMRWGEQNMHQHGELTFEQLYQIDQSEGKEDRYRRIQGSAKELFQHLLLLTDGEAKMVVKSVTENVGGVVELPAELFSSNPSPHDEDPQGVHVPVGDQGPEGPHLGGFAVGAEVDGDDDRVRRERGEDPGALDDCGLP